MLRLPFGRYKDVPLTEVPMDYLDWMLRTCKLSSGLRAAIGDELRRRGQQAPPTPPLPRIPDCRRCLRNGLPMQTWTAQWQETTDGSRRIRAVCGRCFGFLCWLPLLPCYVELANTWSSETALLDVLLAIEDRNIRLESDGRTCWVYWQDLPRVSTELEAKLRECSHRLAGLLGKTWVPTGQQPQEAIRS